MNPEFLTWVKTELIKSLSLDHEVEYTSSVPLASHDAWLLPFIHDHLSPSKIKPSDYPHTIYYLGFEMTFDCVEENCIVHSHWSFHFRSIRHSVYQTILDLNDSQILIDRITETLGLLLQNRFPSIHFTPETILNSDIAPHITQ